MAKVKIEKHDATSTFKPMGTSNESIVKTFDNLLYCRVNKGMGPELPVIVAKDGDGLYLTVKSFVGNGLLDPYKVYNRISVTEEMVANELKELL